jgi:hypothetical protein
MEEISFLKNGGKLIQDIIDSSLANGKREIEISGNYLIEKSIVLPSDITLILNGCNLRLDDGTYCQIIKNKYVEDLDLNKKAKGDKNIHVIGKNGTVLDGGNYNGLSERNYKQTPYHITVNNTVLFANVNGFSVQNIKVVNQRWWGLNFVNCSFGKIKDIDFCSDCTRILGNKTRVKGLFYGCDYESIYIKNSDGIDLRVGCHDIEIRNITGFTEDDTVALTALLGSTEEIYGKDREYDSIFNVLIRDVKACAHCTIVRLLNQSGTRMHDITIENIFDTSDKSACMDKGLYAVRIGDTHLYGNSNICPPENISVKNVFGRQNVIVSVVGEVINGVFENIKGVDDKQIKIERVKNYY